MSFRKYFFQSIKETGSSKGILTLLIIWLALYFSFFALCLIESIFTWAQFFTLLVFVYTLPLSVFFLLQLRAYKKHKARSSAFSLPVFSQIEKIGFSELKESRGKKWNSMGPSYTGILNGYLVHFGVTGYSGKNVYFNFKLNNHLKHPLLYYFQIELFKEYNTRVSINGVKIIINTTDTSIKSIAELRSILFDLTTLLKNHGLSPRMEGSFYANRDLVTHYS